MPIITMRLEGLGQTLTAAFMQHTEEMNGIVEALVKEEIERFDFKGTVRNCIAPAIQRAVEQSIQSYFSYGEGAKVIDSEVKKMVSSS